jgi:hypothetical protein
MLLSTYATGSGKTPKTKNKNKNKTANLQKRLSSAISLLRLQA